jgi:hypothetical protein
MIENIRQRLEILKAVISKPETAKRLSTVSAFAVIAEYKNRIFVDGQTTDGSPIGQYSNNPFYQNPNTLTGVAASGVTPVGKYGNTTFKNGKPHKTRYLSNGYSELRTLTGRQNSTVDLNFSGSLERSIKVVQDGETAVIRYTSDSESAKMTQNERRFGVDISTVSDDERKIGSDAAAEEIRFILDEIDNS